MYSYVSIAKACTKLFYNLSTISLYPLPGRVQYIDFSYLKAYVDGLLFASNGFGLHSYIVSQVGLYKTMEIQNSEIQASCQMHLPMNSK